MTLDRCKEIASTVLGEDVKFHRESGGPCVIHRWNVELGRGDSWRAALKIALAEYARAHIIEMESRRNWSTIWRGILFLLVSLPARLFGLMRKSKKPSAVLRLAK